MDLTAYLSGGMEYADNYGADWRSDMEGWLRNNLAHSCFNPVRESERFLGSRYPDIDFRRSKSEDFEKHRQIARDIVRLDSREIIMRSDYVICFYDDSAQRGAGTKGELTIAALMGKPVYLIRGMDIADIPSWVIGCADRIFDDFAGLKLFLSREYSR